MAGCGLEGKLLDRAWYNVTLCNCTIGDLCVIHNGVCIGQDGGATLYSAWTIKIKEEEGFSLSRAAMAGGATLYSAWTNKIKEEEGFRYIRSVLSLSRAAMAGGATLYSAWTIKIKEEEGFSLSRAAMAGGATLYSAWTIKIKEEEGFRTYYFYEFGRDEQRVALVAAVNSGKLIRDCASVIPETNLDKVIGPAWEFMMSAMRSSTAHFNAMEVAKADMCFKISAWPLKDASTSSTFSIVSSLLNMCFAVFNLDEE
ncbi:hypothetical protein FNV43_RR13565 [Rhamnella rubrinervis]|uniref:Uncharacterized protein n=1 Tax=Rhamnella rubrinervis TaxID=2594499 RepID=A0A8K0H1F1_9ROSA|nr:hypothetical protein FNV43_RR13565 [Rhamnella rubrinervis]